MQTHIITSLLILCAVLLFIPLFNITWRKYRRKITYQRILKEIDDLFANTNPYQIAKQQRLQEKNNFDNLYGEIELCTLLDLIALTHPLPNDIFYDLGSGCGKTVLAVKLGYPMLKVCGIEFSAGLHQLAWQTYQFYLRKHHLETQSFTLTLIQQNFLLQDITDADIVFINATAYTGATWKQILDKLFTLRPGSRVIITSKTLPEPYFCKKYQGMELMSWGLTSTFIFEKRQ